MIFPRPLPDETLGSLLSRLARLNGMLDIRDAISACLDAPPCASFVDAPLNIPDFCKRIAYAYGTPKDFLANLTWLPARAKLGELNDSSIRDIEEGAVSRTLGELIFSGPTLLSYCPLCVKNDISQFGIAYWHRVHQSEIIHRCILHRGALIRKIKIKRKNLRREFPLPGNFYADEKIFTSFDVKATESLWERIALIFREVLADSGDVPSNEYLAAIFKKEKYRFNDFASDIDMEFQSKESRLVKRIIQGLNGNQPELPTGRVLVIYMRFGGWQEFREHVRRLPAQ